MKIVIIKSARGSENNINLSKDVMDHLIDSAIVGEIVEEYEKSYYREILEQLQSSITLFEEKYLYINDDAPIFPKRIDFTRAIVRHQSDNRKPRHLVKKIIH